MIICRPRIGGNGFGNEFMYMAKALVCSMELGARFWKPRWPAPYDGVFTAQHHEPSLIRHRLRGLRYRLTHRWIEVNQSMYQAMGETSISDSVRRYMAEHGLGMKENVVFWFTDLWPDITCVMHQIGYLQAVLLSNPALAAEVARSVRRFDSGKVLVGVHIRRSDFSPEVPLGVKWPEGEFNIRVPMPWYRHVCRVLQRELGDQVQFFLASNSNEPEITSFAEEFSCLRGLGQESRNARDVVDLLTLARADLVVATPSWFSHWALSFSGAPFLWYKPACGAPEYLSHRQPCFAMLSEPALPAGLKEYAVNTWRARRFRNLMEQGL